MRRGNGEGCVFKLSGKRRKPWAVRVTVGWSEDGKQKMKYLGYYRTQPEAKAALREYLVRPYDLEAAGLTLQEVFEAWFPHSGLAELTLRNYKSAFNQCGDLHGRAIRSIKVVDIEAALAAVKPSRQAVLKNCLHNVFAYALKNDAVDRNIVDSVSVKAHSGKEKEPFTLADVRKLCAYSGHHLADTVPMLLYTGMRISELLEIKTADVNLAERFMRGGKKTAAGKNRIIPIHDAILPLVQARVEAGHEFLITGRSGRSVPYASYFANFWRPMRQELGLAQSPHEARHTFVTFCSRQGLDRTIVQKIIGHKLPDTTARYDHRDVLELVSEINKLSYS